MVTIISVYLFTLGLVFGSFSLVAADRSIRKKDWVKGRSECDKCHKKLAPIDLVPLISWLSTSGKCRYCKVKLPATYPAVELTLGLAFVGSYLSINDSLQGLTPYLLFGLWLAGLVLMAILLIIDAKTMRLPYKFLFPLIGVSAIYAALGMVTSLDPIGAITQDVLSVGVGAGIFAVLYAVSGGKWIGDSDVLFGIVIGLYLGRPLESWLAIILACLVGLLYSLLFSIIKKQPVRHAKIPFGPFLIIGLYLTFLYGSQIVDWYLETYF